LHLKINKLSVHKQFNCFDDSSFAIHADVIKELLTKDTEVNAKTNDESTDLIVVVINAHEEMVRLLKKAGAKK
jgi:ankyrin repeat protein